LGWWAYGGVDIYVKLGYDGFMPSKF